MNHEFKIQQANQIQYCKPTFQQADASNFCRNPERLKGAPKCLTLNSDIREEACLDKVCGQHYVLHKGVLRHASGLCLRVSQ